MVVLLFHFSQYMSYHRVVVGAGEILESVKQIRNFHMVNRCTDINTLSQYITDRNIRCLMFFVPLYVAGFGVNAEEELPLLVGPVCGG